MIGMIVALLLSQQGVCKPGTNCQVGTLKTTYKDSSNVAINIAATSARLLFSGSANNYFVGNSDGTVRAPALRLPTSQAVYLNGDTGTAYFFYDGAKLIINAPDYILVRPTGSLEVDTNFSQSIGTTTVPALLSRGNGVQDTGRAFASFPTCNAGNAGLYMYDTTNSCLRVCNGTAWACVSTGTQPFGQALYADAARDFASVPANDCADTAVMTTGLALESWDACNVALTMNGTGGASKTDFFCWPSDTNLVTVRVCCHGAAACDPVSQNYVYYFTCSDGSCI